MTDETDPITETMQNYETGQAWVEFATQNQIEQMMRAILDHQRAEENIAFFERCADYSAKVLGRFARKYLETKEKAEDG
jgi:hemerythrin superfamily protein